ncbi:hypothetical protein EI77_02572 [Prosthecobacter fusiformis]|uniref:Uncharacterized protein n=1 Tax=Prosthecobacter fusiformis TaxID=48464 RepID=A0A4R7S1Z3_9BACT|nr:hypothetical protein EI77_02572 [Prosthecobacter fusiformis]
MPVESPPSGYDAPALLNDWPAGKSAWESMGKDLTKATLCQKRDRASAAEKRIGSDK